MKTNLQYLITGFLCLIIQIAGNCQGEPTALFQKKEVLKLNIVSNINALMKDNGLKLGFHWANMSYANEQGETVTLPVKLKQRGNFRRTTGVCKFPPLLVDFSKKKIENTLFDNQVKLKLVTQCTREDLVFHEYLVYQIYNLLTDLSFKVRLAEVTYLDSLNKRKPFTNYGFFIENETDVAKRNGAENSYHKNLSMTQMDSVDMLTVVLFEYLIANNDWSFPALHNIKLFTKPNKFIAMPYDFDHAGIVEAEYALPPPQLEIATVRERLYRGINYPPSVFQAVFDKFNALKPQIYAIYEGNPLLDARYIKRTVKYLDAFYAEINDPKAINKHFTGGRTRN